MPQRVLILGGGVAAMTCAFELTSQPGWRERYEITVLQMGWRLGGKGASGRNAAYGQRIEEHGLHILLGFYDNFFGVMQRCYDELGRSPDAPLPTWPEAVEHQDLVVLMQRYGDGWHPWPIRFPRNGAFPGPENPDVSVWDDVVMLVEALVEIGRSTAALLVEAGEAMFAPEVGGPIVADTAEPGRLGTSHPGRGDTTPPADRPGAARASDGLPKGRRARVRAALSAVADWVLGSVEAGHEAASSVREAVDAAVDAVGDRLEQANAIGHLAALALHVGSLPPALEDHDAAHHDTLLSLLEAVAEHFAGQLEQVDEVVAPVLHRSLAAVDLILAVLRGLFADGLVALEPDWSSIDHLELRDWMRQHGASEAAVDSPIVQSGYDLIFSHDRGMAAGVGVYGALKLFTGYRGSIFYKMKAGMGDTLFGPLYEVLRRRGVRFRFFQRVDEIVANADGDGIAQVIVGQQATLKHGAYHPLIDVGGLPCWPSEPLYDQLVEGEALRASGEDLEDWWTRWEDPAPAEVLEHGEDFDLVVLGISKGAFSYVAKDLIAKDPAFARMCETQATTNTQAVQLWTTTDLSGLGWDGSGASDEPPVLGTYVEPFDTWADMAHLLPREDWTDGAAPHGIAYLVGGKPDDFDQDPPPRSDHGYTARCQEAVRQAAVAWLRTAAGPLWPKATITDDPDAFNPWFLFDPEHREGWDRLDAQFWTADLNPSDRYNLSLPGTTAFRLGAHDTAFANLYLAGDWTRCWINAGCVEAAAISGLLASQAISGLPQAIANVPADYAEAPAPPTLVPPVPPTRTLPEYLPYPGETVLAPPFQFVGATTTGFVVDADLPTLTALVDRFYNDPRPKPDKVFKPLGPFVFQCWVQIEQARSANPEFADFGWLDERDCLFAIPVLLGTEVDGVFAAEELLLAVPYIWVTQPEAVVQGREIYGYSKEQAHIAMPIAPGEPGEYRCSAIAVRKTDGVGEAGATPLVAVRRTDDGGDDPTVFETLESATVQLGELFARLLEGAETEHTVTGLDAARFLMSEITDARIPMVFLKQFRDVRDGRRACYQAVITSPQHIIGHAGAGMFGGTYEVAVAPTMDMKMIQRLGLKVERGEDGVGRLTSRANLWCTYDFIQAYGDVLWETP